MTEQTSRQTAVQFGAGSVGRGFLGQLFSEGGLETIFIDTDERLIDALETRRRYRLDIVGRQNESHSIAPVRALHANDRHACATALTGAAIACTAVGASAMSAAAQTIAAGLEQRLRDGGEPLTILVCENLPRADIVLRDAVLGFLPADLHGALTANVGFVRTVVARMTPVATAAERADDVAAIRTEAYNTLPVDADAIVGTLPVIPGLSAVGRFQSQIDRKLFAHNGSHAVLGFLGWHAGLEFGWQALEVPQIYSFVAGALNEVSRALQAEWGMTATEMSAYNADLLERFTNQALGDTCIRLCRDPRRKLAEDDRLVGAARLCLKHSVTPVNIAAGIAAAVHYLVNPNEPLADLNNAQAGEVLRDTSNIRGTDPLLPLIHDQLDIMRAANRRAI